MVTEPRAVTYMHDEALVVLPDPLFVAIPRVEIISEMARRGDDRALNDVCLSVAIVAEALNAAWVATKAI